MGRLTLIALLFLGCNLPLNIEGQPEYIHIEDCQGCWARTDTVLLTQNWRIDSTRVSIDDSLGQVWYVEKTQTAGYPPVIKRAELTLQQGETFGDTLRPHLDFVEPEYTDCDIELVKIADTLFISGRRFVKRPCP